MSNIEILLYFPDIFSNNGNFMYIREGLGDNLFPEDIAQGYCDYLMYDILSFNDGIFEEVDGGQILLKENCCDFSEDEIIRKALVFSGYDSRFVKLNISPAA